MTHRFADRTFDRVSSGGVSSNWFSSCFLVNWDERLLRLWIRRFGSSCTKQGWGEVLFKVLKLSTSTFILNLSISISTLSFFVQYLSTFTSTSTCT